MQAGVDVNSLHENHSLSNTLLLLLKQLSGLDCKFLEFYETVLDAAIYYFICDQAIVMQLLLFWWQLVVHLSKSMVLTI